MRFTLCIFSGRLFKFKNLLIKAALVVDLGGFILRDFLKLYIF